MVKITLPVGVTVPLAGVTVAVRVYADPAVRVPLGLIPSTVVVPIAATVSFRVFDVLPRKVADPW
jgi:hypothetical protein